MTDAEREALVERIKKEVAREHECDGMEEVCKRWPEDCTCGHIARAALAVAEPVVREAVASDLERMGRGHVAHEHALILRMVERIRARGAA